MGLTLIRKNRDSGPKRDPVVALVLAGGAVSGGAFKVGGLKALNDFLVGRSISDLDMYVGLSAGALLGASLAGGITPDGMIEVPGGIHSQVPYSSSPRRRMSNDQCGMSPHLVNRILTTSDIERSYRIEHTELLLG